MIPIKIDLSDLTEEFSLKRQQVQELGSNLLDTIVANYVQSWERNVIRDLHGTRRQYLEAIYVDKTDDHNAIVGLNPKSKLALMIEGGASSFDMKEGFKKSSKLKYDSSGNWYLIIPFRHATPGAIGESELFSNKLPQDVYNLAKANQGKGLTKQQLPKEFQTTGVNPTTGYQHKANIFEGLKRVNISSTRNENRGGYMTFRRVSENSDKDSWVHRGFVARNLMQKSLNQLDVPTIVDNVSNNFLKDL